jgi:DNA modification methylase
MPIERNRVLHGDALEQLKTLPDGCVQCVVTSPPYWGLRDYGVEGQIGLEPTPALYVAKLVEVFREVRRVLRSDGSLWLNLGDSYVASKRGNKPGDFSTSSLSNPRRQDEASARFDKTKIGLKQKDLIGIPWRVAFALQDDGWYLRSDVIWSKPTVMPESVRDRPTKSHEYVFLLTKSATYFYDADAVREPSGGLVEVDNVGEEDQPEEVSRSTGRNKRSVWTISPRPYKGAHFAVMPPELPTLCIRASTSARGSCGKCGAPWERLTERGEDEVVGWAPPCNCEGAVVPCIVLDPFAGSGTTLQVARDLDRDFIGIELNESYRPLINARVAGAESEAASREVFRLMMETK